MNALKFSNITIFMAVAFLFACRGQTMKTTPVHVVWNMDEQYKFEAFQRNEFFADNRAMRTPVQGTVHRGGLRQDSALYRGINEDSSFVEEIPVAVTRELLLRGQDQYEVYCTPCHGVNGEGRGVIITGGYGFVPPPSYYEERILNMPAGEMYSAIANGVRTMFSYANQIPVKDRWAIVAYIQALQKSRRVTSEELASYDITESELIKKANATGDTAAAPLAAIGGVVSAQAGQQLIVSYGCTSCHSTENEELYAPSFRGLYGSTVALSDGSMVQADRGYLVESMQYPAAKIVRGYMAEMPSYRDLMTDQEMYSVVEYLKTLQGSAASGTETPADTTSAAPAPADTAAAEPALTDTTSTENNETQH